MKFCPLGRVKSGSRRVKSALRAGEIAASGSSVGEQQSSSTPPGSELSLPLLRCGFRMLQRGWQVAKQFEYF